MTFRTLVPPLRRLGAEIPRAAARQFNQIAWPAFAVLHAREGRCPVLRSKP